jgi:hypothetical protein
MSGVASLPTGPRMNLCALLASTVLKFSHDVDATEKVFDGDEYSVQ